MYIKEACRSLYSTKQRTFLALLGIVIGIGSVIALVSIGNIVSYEATKRFRAMGTDLMKIELDANNGDYSLHSPGLISALAAHTPCLRNASGYVRDTLTTKDKQYLPIFGVSSDFIHSGKLTIDAGRFISDLDDTQQYVVLGAKVPEILELGAAKDLPGKEFQIQDDVYIIVGVLKFVAPLQEVVRRLNKGLFIPIKTGLERSPHASIDNVIGRMVLGVNQHQCITQTKQYFARRNKNIEMEVVTADQLIAEMREQSDMYAVLLAAIGSISLIVGGVGIMNIMLMSVSERRQEIGIRRALGAHRKDIRYQFLTESIVLSIIGGFLGIALGALCTYVVSDIMDWGFFMPASAIFLGAGVSIFIGVFFGFLPAHQAAKLDPIKALRGV